MSNNAALLAFNERGALSSLLAIEEHLQKAAPGSSAWCCRKHSLICVDHHLAEAANHAARIDPRKAEACRRLRAKAELVLHPSRPLAPIDVGQVAELRNEVRRVFSDPTLVGSGCSVCSNDGGISGAVDRPWRPWLGPLLGVGVLIWCLRSWR